ncbi:MAG: tyrosine-type recombinase/integrase [Flavobacteriaceae bacterium]
MAKFLVAFASVDLEQLTLEQITQFLVSLQKREKISVAYQKQIVATIAKFYQLYYNKHLDLTVLYPHKKAKPLPRYLTIPEVKRLLNQCNNIKHLCILNILYGCGLRVSEVVSLKIIDIDSAAMRLMVRNAKGQKDRVVPLPKTLLDNLRTYYMAFRPKHFLFEGQKGAAYSVKSIQQLTKKYARMAQINKLVTPHILRHSYATHQLENVVNIRYVQELLGHNSIKTTEVYTHISKVTQNSLVNPLDKL